MLPIELKSEFLHFLSEVDRFTSYEVTKTKGRVGEVATTAVLLRCLELDPKVKAPQGLCITAANFRAKLEEIAGQLPGAIDVQLQIRGEGFSQIFEGVVTQADYALHLSFEDTSSDAATARSHSWDAYYFIQAKIARTPGEDASRNEHVWGDDARFGVTDGQPFAIECARELLGDTGLRYNLYCPRDALQIVPESHVYRKIRDYCASRGEEWAQAEAAGLWLARDLPGTLGDLLASPDPTVCPWALFILDHYFGGNSEGVSAEEIICRDSSVDDNIMATNRKKLFERNPTFVQKLKSHLQKRGAKRKLKALHTFTSHGYRPAITITLKFPGYDYVYKPAGPSP